MDEGWHLVSASLDSKDNWGFLLGKPNVGLDGYDPDVGAYPHRPGRRRPVQ